jgi:hypothetical protein
MKENKLTNAFITIGLLGGLMYGIKKDKGISITTLYGIGFGILGALVGNTLSKLQKD